MTNNIQTIKALASFKRYEKWQNEDYLVLPAVLLTEGVHNDLYYSPEQLAKYPSAWDGRPIPIHHPSDNGIPVSCNSPNVLPNSVGHVFNTRYDGGKLKAELWLNKKKLQEFDNNTFRDLEAGKPVEISTGLWSDEIGSAGSWNGEGYTAAVTDIKPDHVALLPGSTGACSWRDGCGVPRLNEAKGGNMTKETEQAPVTNDAVQSQDVPVANSEQVTGPMVQESAIQEPNVPKLAGAIGDQQPQNEPDGPKTNDCTEGSDGVKTTETKKNVWERLKDWFKANEVECEDQHRLMLALESIENNQENNVNANGGESMSKELVTKLIEDETTQYDEEDREWLEGLEEAKLKKLSPKVVKANTKPVPKVEEPKQGPLSDVLSSKEFAQAVAVTVKTLMDKEKKTDLIAKAKKLKGLSLTDAEIHAMPETALVKLIKANASADFSGRGVDSGTVTNIDDSVPEPPAILMAKIEKEVRQ